MFSNKYAELLDKIEYYEKVADQKQKLKEAQEQLEDLLAKESKENPYVGALIRYDCNAALMKSLEKRLTQKEFALSCAFSSVSENGFYLQEQAQQQEKQNKVFELEATVQELFDRLQALEKQQAELKAFIDANAIEYEQEYKKQEESRQQFESFGGANWY